jgi:hypothetical protein
MFVAARSLPTPGGRPRLYLAFGVGLVLGMRVESWSNRVVETDEIEATFSRAEVESTNLDLVQVLAALDRRGDELGTEAYWALTYAIGVYMWQMAKAAIEIDGSLRPFDCAHRRLLEQIENQLELGNEVGVVDFNYDCVLESEQWGRGRNTQFGWKVGRCRVVPAIGMGSKMGDAVNQRAFVSPMDVGSYTHKVALVKPHGDYCTFLRGQSAIYYSGGRHSTLTTAILPARLADIRATDSFVRSSILPPTESRHRREAIFYEDEQRRMLATIYDADCVVVVGWSAAGTDGFYKRIFAEVRPRHRRSRRLFVVDRCDGRQMEELVGRLSDLLGGGTTLTWSWREGFSEEAVRALSTELGLHGDR